MKMKWWVFQWAFHDWPLTCSFPGQGETISWSQKTKAAILACSSSTTSCAYYCFCWAFLKPCLTRIHHCTYTPVHPGSNIPKTQFYLLQSNNSSSIRLAGWAKMCMSSHSDHGKQLKKTFMNKLIKNYSHTVAIQISSIAYEGIW